MKFIQIKKTKETISFIVGPITLKQTTIDIFIIHQT